MSADWKFEQKKKKHTPQVKFTRICRFFSVGLFVIQLYKDLFVLNHTHPNIANSVESQHIRTKN